MKPQPLRTSRRSFIKGLAVTTGGLVVPRVFWAQEGGPASRKLNIAAIGCGGKGESDLNAAARGNNVVAICDVDSRSLTKAAGRYSGAKQFSDFRQMLDEVKEIDAVTISTSDHAHFPAAMHAIGLGKHVCVQKPLANTLWELREMHLAATKKGVITQMGNQGHTYNDNRMLKEWLDAGVVGKVKEIHVWTNRPIWPQGNTASFKPGDAPDFLNWPLWLAQCPDMPYSPEMHPFKWRGYLEFGGGAIGDMGCHLMDPIFYALDLGIPRHAEAITEELTDVAWPRGGVVKLTWKNHAKLGEVTMTWYEGKNAEGKQNLPTVPPELGNEKLGGGGWMIIGSEGVILNRGDQCKNPQIFPEARRTEIPAQPEGWRPAGGVDARDQERQGLRLHGEIRLLRAAHRTRPPRRPRHARGQADRVGQRQAGGRGHAGRGALHQARGVSQRLGLHRGENLGTHDAAHPLTRAAWPRLPTSSANGCCRAASSQ